jgi:hypothetical protein
MTADIRFRGENYYMVFYGTALDQILRSPNGDAVRLMMRRADYLQRAAKAQIRLGHIHGGSGFGNLRDSITKHVMSSAGGGMPIVTVGSDHPIALIHHNGTRAHVIQPRYRKALRFPGHTKSGWQFAKIVHHPGTKPNRYLTDNLDAAMKVE